MLQHLRTVFTRFLHRRRRQHHFHRGPVQHVLAEAPRAPAGSIPQDLLALSRLTPAESLARLHAHPQGLSVREAAGRRRRHGANVIAEEGPQAWPLHLLQGLRDPFNLLLSTLALAAGLAGDTRAAGVIAIMVMLSTLLRVVQERRSVHAVDRLRTLVAHTAQVMRAGGGAVEQPVARLVPGDVVNLAAGDMVPADGRVLRAHDLFVSEATLSGESLPVEKTAEPEPVSTEPATTTPPGTGLGAPQLLFMGTSVVSGTATMLVARTGVQTCFGALAATAGAPAPETNAFQAGVNGVSWLLIRFAAVMVPLVWLVQGLHQGDWPQALLFALSVAVGLTPEMLPMVVTSTLAAGAVRMARRRVIVKRLDAIQTLGAMDVLCTDKTGTLTQDRIVLQRHEDPWGQPSKAVLAWATLNSRHQTGLRNLLDRAILEHAQSEPEPTAVQAWHKVDEIPFDFERRRMSVVVGRPGQAAVLVCKGGLREVLSVCTHVMAPQDRPGPPLPLEAAGRERLAALADRLGSEGLRVVAVALREVTGAQSAFSAADERDLVWVGHIAFLDPPRDSAASALKDLAAHGVEVKILTGDHEGVAQHLARLVGLDHAGTLIGSQIDALDDAALALAVRDQRVFARLAPQHKARLVRALKAQGRVVGFLGDGINDAAALRAADVGLSVDTAVDIAREAADIVLLDKQLGVVGEGVVEGRATFCNLLKYIRMTASSNFGNVVSVLVASAWLPFLPLLPLQLLVQNLLYDASQIGIPFDRVEPDQLQRPLRWDPKALARFMWCFGPVSSLFDLAAFALMLHVFGADTQDQQALFHSGVFVVGLLTQTLVVHLIRTPGPLGRNHLPSAALLGTTLAVVLIGLWLPTSPLAADFGLQPLPLAFHAWLAALLLAYGALVSAVKAAYVRRFGWP